MGALAFLIIGEPTATRVYTENAIARFSPTLRHGLVQMLGEAFLLVLVAYIGRRWFRLRL